MTDSIHDQFAAAVERVADARAHHARLKTVTDEARERFESEYHYELEWVKAASAYVADAEAAVKALAMAHFLSTGEKKPTPGIEVKEFTTLTYPEAEALAWAKESGLCLVLDKKGFEKVAKVTDLPFVTKGEEPRVSIASDLTPFVSHTP